MLFCENINIYNISSWSELRIDQILSNLRRLLPNNHLIYNTNDTNKFVQIEKKKRKFLESKAIIKDIKTPLSIYNLDYNYQSYRTEKRKIMESVESPPPLYINNQLLFDGFMVQRILKLEEKITWKHNYDQELTLSTLHIIITDKLLCTFDETDWRYHARSLICGNPTLISTSGIVEGLAKPRDYYYKLYFYEDSSINDLNQEYSNRYIDYGDARINDVIEGLILQSLFYFINSGDPFCKDKNCRFFNAHYHEDAIRTSISKTTCNIHTTLLKNYNQNLFQIKNKNS